MKKLIAFLCFIALISCETEKIETVTVPGKYTVELPGFLSKATTLHDDASLQYQNTFKEFYVVIIDEPKLAFTSVAEGAGYSPDLQGYFDILTDSFQKNSTDAKIENKKDIQINGLKGKSFTSEATLEENNIEVFYKVAYVEGKNEYYQIVTWTLKDSKEKYSQQMDQIISSFKELGTSRGADRSKK